MAELRLGQFAECEASLKSGFELDPENKNLKECETKLAEARKKAEEEGKKE